MEDIKLSKKGNALIKLYEEMATKGIDRVDGTRKEKVYNDFQLRNLGIYVNIKSLMRK